MSGPLSRQEASRLLGVPSSADPPTVKRAYRRLAQEHHPDRGGDPGTFHRLRLAYERLTDDDRPAPPQVARGRPSRPPVAFTSEDERTEVGGIAWDVPIDGGRPARLDRDRLAALLARALGDTPMTPLSATSRGPGSRLNRIAPSLASHFTARLRIAPSRDDRGQAVVRADVTATSRRARRALDRADVAGAWTRTRGSSSTTLTTSLEPSQSARITAVRVTERVDDLLAALGWPLGEWTLTDEGR